MLYSIRARKKHSPNNGKGRAMHTSKSDAARAEMAAAAPALAAVPREPVAKLQKVEEPVAEQVVATQVERGQVH